MPYAADGQIAQFPLKKGIEIAEEQYAEALQAMGEGKHVAIKGGKLVLVEKPK